MYGQAALRQQSRQPCLSTRESIEARVGRFCGGPSDQRPGDDDSWATRPPTNVCTKNDESGVCVDHWRPAGGRACACLATSGRCARSERPSAASDQPVQREDTDAGDRRRGKEGRRERYMYVTLVHTYHHTVVGHSCERRSLLVGRQK